MSYEYGTEPACTEGEHDWTQIKSTKEACRKCRVQRKTMTREEAQPPTLEDVMGMVRGYATALEMYDSAVAEGFTGAEISLRLDRFQEAGAAIEAALKPLYARLEKADALAEVVTAADDYGYWWCGVCVHDEPGESRDTIPHRDDCRLADYRRTEGR